MLFLAYLAFFITGCFNDPYYEENSSKVKEAEYSDTIVWDTQKYNSIYSLNINGEYNIESKVYGEYYISKYNLIFPNTIYQGSINGKQVEFTGFPLGRFMMKNEERYLLLGNKLFLKDTFNLSEVNVPNITNIDKLSSKNEKVTVTKKIRVRRGDTIKGISNKYGMTEDEFLILNHRVDMYGLMAGTWVVVYVN